MLFSQGETAGKEEVSLVRANEKRQRIKGREIPLFSQRKRDQKIYYEVEKREK